MYQQREAPAATGISSTSQNIEQVSNHWKSHRDYDWSTTMEKRMYCMAVSKIRHTHDHLLGTVPELWAGKTYTLQQMCKIYLGAPPSLMAQSLDKRGVSSWYTQVSMLSEFQLNRWRLHRPLQQVRSVQHFQALSNKAVLQAKSTKSLRIHSIKCTVVL